MKFTVPGKKKGKELPSGWPEREYWTTEHRFHPTRKWRFDFAYVALKIAVEQEGGIWIRGKSGHGGAHSLPTNILRDMEKSNAAQALGWRIFRFTPTQIRNGEAATFMRNLLQGKL